jgi:hypothetical protein
MAQLQLMAALNQLLFGSTGGDFVAADGTRGGGNSNH